MKKRCFPFLLTLILVMCGTLVSRAGAQNAAPEWEIVEELWHSLEMMGGKAGWSSAITHTNGKEFRTTSETSMKISRGAVPIEITMQSIFTETIGGKPVSVESKQLMATQAMESRWNFHDDHVEVISKQGGRETTKQQPLPTGEWLTPKAAERFARAQRASGAEEFQYRMLEAQSGLKPITVTTRRAGEETLEHDGRPVQVTVWKSVTDIVPVEATEKIDDRGRVIYQETTLPGLGKMVTRLTTKAEATGAADAPAVPEMLFQTFIAPDKPIESASKTVGSKLRLRVKEGVMPELPSAGAQRVEMAPDGKSALLIIDIHDNVPASAADLTNEDYRAASPMIDSNDELIQKLAKRALDRRESGEEEVGTDVMQRAEALRRLARKHISRKGMQTAFASASETAKMRTGDCSEHGVLLAALLRADGIPARVATGLVYADAFAGHDDIFGWHMWTQALIDGAWVDFDATLPNRYNAVHVLVSTSTMSEGLMATDMVAAIQLIGNLNIEVVDVRYEGQ